MNSPTANPEAALRTAPLMAEDGSKKALLRIFTVSLLVWSLDYKATTSAGGGSAVQALILAVYVVTAFYVAISALWRDIGVGPVWLLIAAIVLFVIESAVVALINDQDPYSIFVNTIPPLLFASSSAITFMTLRSLQDDAGSFLKMLRWACLIFVVVHLVIVTMTKGSIDVSDARYEVLSAATTPALAIIAIGFLKRLSRLDIVVFSLNLIVSVISVTRTLLFVLAVQIAMVVAARPRSMLKPTTIKSLSVFGGAMLLILALDLSAGTGIAERWFERVTVSKKTGADPTSLTRKAEVKFMLRAFATSPETILFGNGLAALTSLTGPEARLAGRLVGIKSVSFHSIGFGHENYVSVLFISGVLGGGGLLIMQFLNGFQAFTFLRTFKLTELDEDEVHIGLWGALIVIGSLAIGFYGGTLADRDLSIWYGLGTGMLYWARIGRTNT
jgi:hypothetical protein